MKVLFISDNNEDINFISSFVEYRGYDIIIYRKFLKAMDNLEEIKPDIIILDSYIIYSVRKMFSAFMQDNLIKSSKVYIYNSSSNLGESKTKALDFDYVKIINKENIGEYFPYNNVLESKINNIKDSQIIFTNPIDGSFLSGKIINVSDDCFECNINTNDLRNGQQLQYVSISCNGNVSFLSANVVENNRESGTLSLTVCEYYETV